MGFKRPAWLAWTLSAVVVVFALLWLASALAAPGAPENVPIVMNQVMTSAYTIVFGLVAALILARYPRHTIGWLLMVLAVSLAVFGFLESVLERGAGASPELTLSNWLLFWLNGWAWWLLMGPLLLILLLFPTGRLLSPRWRWIVGMLAMLIVFFLFFATFSKTLTDTSGKRVPNPLGVIPENLSFDAIYLPWVITLITTVAACVISVFVRYRRAAFVEREQIKWFVCACAVFLCVYAVGGLASDSEPNNWYGALFNTVILLIPLSIGVAILRYRLWDINLIIRRTLIYGALTAMLALFYFGAVVLLQQLFHLLTGQGSNDLAIILSTLGIAALFVPLRSRAQRAIDRRFYRRKYDATHVLEAFGATVRDEVDLNRLTDELRSVVQETMQPEHVGVWLVRAKK